MPAFDEEDFYLYDHTDSTKQVRFELGSVGTGSLRTFTFPNASGTLALIDASSQQFSGANTFAGLTKVLADQFEIVHSGDYTKRVLWDTSGSSALVGATTLLFAATAARTVTFPNATTTLAGLSVAQTWDAPQTWNTELAGSPMIFSTDPGGLNVAFQVYDQTSGKSCSVTITGAGLTANRTIAIPDATGTLLFNNGTFTGSCSTAVTLITSSASSGVSFTDTTTSTKKLRVVLSGSVGNNSLTLANTAARDYKFQDQSGSVVVCGNTTAASGVLGTSDLTAQTGSIAAVTMVHGTGNPAGMYRLSFYIKTTTAGTALDVVKATVAFNDGSAQTVDVPLEVVTAAAPALNQTHDLATNNKASYGEVILYSAASNAVTYTTTVTKTGSPQYTIRVRAEFLGA